MERPVPRTIMADNPSAMTLDGTRTFLIGRRRVAIIDPGPADPAHIDAVARSVGHAAVVAVLLTHHHPDHAAAGPTLARILRAPLHSARDVTLADGDRFETDAGALRALATPGHTPDHIAFHWPDADAAFVGDLLMGGQETALVAAPEGDLHDYLVSLERVRQLVPRTLYPTHGPATERPATTIDAYVRHRHERLRQVLAALQEGPLDQDGIVDAVYGTGLDTALRSAARGSVTAYLRYLADNGQVRPSDDGWSIND